MRYFSKKVDFNTITHNLIIILFLIMILNYNSAFDYNPVVTRSILL